MVAIQSVSGAILKTMYHSTVHDMVNTRHDILGMLRKEDVDGEEYKMLHRVGGTTSMRFQAEAAVLPLATNQRWTNSSITAQEWWATGEISQRMMSLSKSDPGSFIRGLESEVKYIGDDAHKYWERAVLGDGSGVLATVREREDAGSPDFIGIDIWDQRKFEVGVAIEIWSARTSGATQRNINNVPGLPTNQNSVKAIYPDPTNPARARVELVFNAHSVAQDYVVGDVIVVSGTRTSTVGYEIEGLDSAISDRPSPMKADGTFQAIKAPFDSAGARQTDGEIRWSASVFRAGTPRAPTERVLQRACDAVEIHGNNAKVDKWITGYGARLEFAVQQTNIRRSMNTREISGKTGGGFSENTRQGKFIEYGDAVICPNRFQRPDVILGTVWSDLALYYWARQQFWDQDGSVIRRSPTRKTTYEFEMFAFSQFGVEHRNKHARIEDVEHNEQLLL